MTIKLSTAGAVLVTLGTLAWNVYSWAEEKHEKIENLARQNSAIAGELKQSNALLKQAQAQQLEDLRESVKTARENKETLIRIEALLERSASSSRPPD